MPTKKKQKKNNSQAPTSVETANQFPSLTNNEPKKSKKSKKKPKEVKKKPKEPNNNEPLKKLTKKKSRNENGEGDDPHRNGNILVAQEVFADESLVVSIKNLNIEPEQSFVIVNGQSQKPDSLRESENQNPSDDSGFEVIPSTSSNARDNFVEDSSDDDDDSFFNDDLFARAVPTFESVETEMYSDDSDSETEPLEIELNIFIDKFRAAAVAEYEGIEYRIGFLDLNEHERACTENVRQTAVSLYIKANDIKIHDGKLNVERIIERQVSPNEMLESCFDQLNLGRVQFSITEPFLAKYENELYIVGHKLYNEYHNVLNRTKKPPGTAIRIANDQLVIDVGAKTLDVISCFSFKHQNEICVVNGSFDANNVQDDYPLTEYRRFMIGFNPYVLMEVEPALLHSSIYDDRTEISISKPKLKTETYNPEDERLEMLELKTYAVPEEIKLFTNTQKRRSIDALKKTKFNELLKKKSLRKNVEDYVNGSKLMLHLEEEANAHDLKRYNQTNIKLVYHMDRQFYFPITEEQTELAAAIEENVLDFLKLQPKSSNREEKVIRGQVHGMRDRNIYIEIFPETFRLIKKAHQNEVYDISFILTRVPYKVQHYALDFIKKKELFTKLIHNSYYDCKSAKLPLANRVPSTQKHQFKTEGTMLQNLNAEQQLAVKNIISKTGKLPYVLFGPPGTGKTRTLAAAIEQIVRTTKQNVLVCAMSNAACDEITERLLDVLNEDEMYRFYARSYKHERISSRIKHVSNIGSERIFYPELKYLYKFRVFICTLCSAACLTRARIDKAIWKANHFSYVFIDECASAHETMSLIPIAGLCTSKKEIFAKIILAGDPKQLDAVTKSDAARQMGYNTSWMERLCDSNLYQRKNGKFNELYITQLVRNYRSHPEILRIPNELFYEGVLEPCAKKSDIDWYINSTFLPSKQFPLIFKSVKGECERSLEKSWYNEKEIDEIVKTIQQLLPSHKKKNGLRKITSNDIGVVTPYRKQRNKICQKLRRLHLDEVTVGTAEIFQGKEKPIMIISTVRSNGDLGFVAEPRRLNVVITRAKCLVVIIGDPHTLKTDPNWRRLIQHCIQNNSFIQGNKHFSLR